MGYEGMEDLKEAFVVEASELLNEAEESLLQIEKGESLSLHFNRIFRALHSIKGGAGMIGMTDLQNCLHKAESHFQTFHQKEKLPAAEVSYFLKTIDESRQLLRGETIELKNSEPGQSKIPGGASIAGKKVEAGKWVSSEPLRAVIIDDEPLLVENVCEILVTEGFVTKGFSNPQEAIREIPHWNPDVVLCDMKMPEMTGLDVLKAINSGKNKIPVIFVSGYLDREVLMDAINNGARAVIEKPFDQEYVIKVAFNIARECRLGRLFDKTMNLLLYQYSDFDDFLKSQGRQEVRQIIEAEMKNLIEQRRVLREMNKKIG